MLVRVLARLPLTGLFHLQGVCRRWHEAGVARLPLASDLLRTRGIYWWWHEAAGSPAFLAAYAHVPVRNP